MTKIAWTDATWNPVTGCSHVSEGCRHCYAETLSLRRGWSKKPWTAQNAAENVVLHPERLKQPLHWRKPRRVFVNSMSDLFHEEIPIKFIDQVFAVMAFAHRHMYQVLTKRPVRMQGYLASRSRSAQYWKDAARTLGFALEFEAISLVRFPLPNVWLGVSCEDQGTASERIPILLDTPSAVRFVSCEPLLGPISLEALSQHWLGVASQRRGMNDGLDWIIVGGESGPNCRQMVVGWLEAIASQCGDAGVPLFVKQDSGPFPGKQGLIPDHLWQRKEFPA